MGFTIESNRDLKDIKIIDSDVFYDERGKFTETFSRDFMSDNNIDINILQENESVSAKNVIRGMHFQWDKPMGKLLRVLEGSIILVEIDIRYNSPTFGKHCIIPIDSSKPKMVWIPPGFANGFLSLDDNTRVLYKCTSTYNPNAESSINPYDKEINIDWVNYLNGSKPVLSKKDSQAQTLKNWMNNPNHRSFSYYGIWRYK